MHKNSILIPIHEYNSEIEKSLDKAVSSVFDQESYNFHANKYEKLDEEVIKEHLPIYIVTNNEVKKQLKKEIKSKVTDIIVNKSDLHIQKQMNLGFEKIDSEYITLLEVDDFFSSKYFKNLHIYQDEYPDQDAFMSLQLEVDYYDTNKLKGFNNHYLWSRSVFEEDEVGTKEIDGNINFNMVKRLGLNRLSGITFKKDSYLSCGKLKNNIVQYFNYEFLLRFLNNGFKVKLMDKIGYVHTLNRQNSYDEVYNIQNNTLSKEEIKYWLNIASKEYEFENENSRPTFKYNKQ